MRGYPQISFWTLIIQEQVKINAGKIERRFETFTYKDSDNAFLCFIYFLFFYWI